jgi:serine/threonine-protein kinase HipA
MLSVWADDKEAGTLDRFESRGSAFSQPPGTSPSMGVSLTMQPRLASWNVRNGLHPVFDMNVPEGALREKIRLGFAKATGRFDHLDLLAVVGRSQIGRLRYTPKGEDLDEEVPFQSVDAILSARGESGELYEYLVERFSRYSGLSGVQPKVLVRDPGGREEETERVSFRGATHIVKFWDQTYPQLAANEFFCLRLAQEMGLEVPGFRLADNGGALVVDRFDLRDDGTYRGFEDFCVLNGYVSEKKYYGSYETGVFKTMDWAIDPATVRSAKVDAFRMLVLSHIVRNGDAHLKNFGIMYDDPSKPARLSPVYDVVSTTVYIPKDSMALTLDGRKTWPDRKSLTRMGAQRAGLTKGKVDEIFEGAVDAAHRVMDEIRSRMSDDPAFAEIGSRMLDVWTESALELVDHPAPATGPSF